MLKPNVKTLARHLKSFINHLDLSDVILVGNSLGGHLGLLYTIKNQEKVKALLLTASSGLYEKSFGDGYPRRGDKEFLRAKIKHTFYDPKMVTDEIVDKCYDAVNNRLTLFRILVISKSAIRDNLSALVPKITIPVGLIWGKNDNVTPPYVADDFHKLIPNSKIVLD